MGFLARILVPVEFSERCVEAARYAAFLADRFQSDVTLLHVLLPPPALAGDPLQDLAARLEERLNTFVGELAGPRVRRLVIKGDPARKIVQYALNERADLILMPTRGFGPLRRFILGSNTAKVLHDADCPVWTSAHLEEAAADRFLTLRHIVCAVDLGPQSRKALDFAVALQAKFETRLTIAHATPAMAGSAAVRDSAHQELEQLRRESGAPAALLIEPGEPAQVLSEAVRRLSADAMVIGRGSAAGAFGRLRTNAYGIIRESPCPVFSV
jgi:nucleotide-binding universal stress UspA family protein